jgi:hypothetical protein
MMGMRGSSVGSDTLGYYEIYKIVMNSGASIPDLMQAHAVFPKAPLWTLLLKGVSILFPQIPQIYFWFTGIFIITAIWLSIYISKVPCQLAVILYYLLFFTTSLNGTRSFMAISLVLLGYVLLDNNKTIIGACLIVAAIFIHNTAIIGIPIVLIKYMNFSKKMMQLIMGSIVIAFFLLYQKFINLYLSIFPVYITSVLNTPDTVSGKNIITQIIYVCCFLYGIYLSCRKSIHMDISNRHRLRKLCLIMLLEILVAIVGMQIWYFQRVLIYLQLFVVVLFPKLCTYKNRYRKLAPLIVYSVSIAFFTYRLIRNMGGVMPYVFYWQ